MTTEIMLDACCLINLLVSGRDRDILTQIPYSCFVAQAALKEAQEIETSDGERERVDLSPLIADSLLKTVSVEGAEEEARVVQVAGFGRLGPGEIETVAIAITRGYGVATDDRKAKRIAQGIAPTLSILGTCDLLQGWQHAGTVTPGEL